METGAVAPPRLAPVSGVLNQGQCVIKPIACRPVVSSANSTPILGHRFTGSPSHVVTTSPCPGAPPPRAHVYNSTSDLRPLSKASTPVVGQQNHHVVTPLQRFSWSSKGQESDLLLHRAHHVHRKPDTHTGSSAGSSTGSSTASAAGSGRVADLSRRFGGSLSSVANSPVQNRQPPAYRPPPNSRIGVKGNGGNGALYSSSELHLNRVATRSNVQPQWVLGGSEVNLTCLSRSTLPRQESHQNVMGTKSYEPIHRNGSASNSRSSWAGLPSAGGGAAATAAAAAAVGGAPSEFTYQNRADQNGSSFTLNRRDDAATPIVEEGGKIRSGVQEDWSRTRSGSLGSAGSLEDFDDDNDVVDGTPSPSDSGVSVAELEAQLKEKDCEIGLLRETLEQNEAVIFQVYQEKEKSWERELKKLRSHYEERMRSTQQQALQAERQLQSATTQWQADRKLLKQQVQQLLKKEQQSQSRLEETSWSLCQKNGEMALLKSQLKEAAGEASGRAAELSKLRCQVKETQDQLHNTRQRLEHVVNERQPPLDNRRQGTSSSELHRLQRRAVEQQQSIEAERQVWHEEKATVLVYQRHLQQQYVQAMKRNQQLEEALGLLGITGVPSTHLENSSPKSNQSSMSSPKSTFSSSSDPNAIDLDSSSSSSHGETPC